MQRHFGIRKRRELKGGTSNVDKLAKDFAEQIKFGKAEDQQTQASSEAIKKKFSI